MVVDRKGEKHTTNEGYEVEIIEYYGVKNCTIHFKCGFILKNLQYGAIKDGRIKYPFHPSVFSIGCFGVGEFFQKRNGIRSCTYNTWKNMLERCYSKKESYKHPSYKNVTVCKEWHNFQNFGEWFENNYIEGWHLDKDILIKGNKIYSPETCCFIPSKINTLFISCNSVRGKYPIGVIKHKEVFRARINRNKKYEHIGLFNTPEEAFQAYKTAKEQYIKEVADKYKDQISSRVYKAMYNYKIEIDD